MKNVILTMLLIIGFSTLGYPCICFTPDFPLKYLSQNDTLPKNGKHFLIKGLVIGRINNIYNRFGKGQAYNIKVLEYWDYDVSTINDTVTIIDDESDCAVYFQKDSTYLIGAYSAHRYLATSSCEGTALVSRYNKQIEELGPGITPKTAKAQLPVLTSDNEDEKGYGIDFVKIGFFALLVFSFMVNVYLIRKNKKACG